MYPGEGDDPLLLSSEETLAIKEYFRFSKPESGEQVLWVKAESVLNVAAVYDVIDEGTWEYVGAIERNVSSVLKHSYTVRNHSGEMIATIKEDSCPRAVVRRKVTSALPFTDHIAGPEGEAYGTISEGFSSRNQYSIELEPSQDAATDDAETVEVEAADAETAAVTANTKFDPRLAIVSIVVIDAGEQKCFVRNNRRLEPLFIILMFRSVRKRACPHTCSICSDIIPL